MGGEERVERQHASGRLTVRERIERLFDPGTFHETGALAGRGSYGDDGELTDFLPANTVVGQGRIDGRRAVVQGDDFTVRGGAADAAIWEKAVYAERLAHDLRIPLVRLVDGTGGGGSVKSLEDMGFSYVPPLPGFDLVVREPGDRAGGRRRARPGRRARRRAGGVLALLGDRARTPRSCSWPARRWWRWRAWARRPTRRSSAARGCRPAPARWTTWRPTRTTRSPSSSASSPTSRRASGRRRRSSDAADPRRPARGGAALDRAARPAQALQDAPHPRGGARPRLGLRAGRRLRPPDDHLPRAARRAARSACSPPTPSTTAAASPRTPPRRSPASWTCATSSTCRS